MGLPEHPAQLSLFGVEHLLGDAFAASDPYKLFQQRVYPLLLSARPTLEACYCRDNGRPAREPVLLGITLLQFMEKQPDRQAMATLQYHLGWKLALGQELALQQLDPSLLVYFRRRLLQARRAEQKTEVFKEQMHRRHGIEGTISELVRGHGMRRSRYRGQKKVGLGQSLTAAACNVKRWLRRMAYEMTSGPQEAVAERTGLCAAAMA